MCTSGKISPKVDTAKNNWPIVIYDQAVRKSAPDILYEAAWAHNSEKAKDKWKKFTEQVKLDGLSEQQIKVMLHTLDDKKQWAPIHYAVDANNLYVFQKLTEDEKRFRCNINLNGGNGENVLHIAAQSEAIWKNINGTDKIEPEQSVKAIVFHVEVSMSALNLPEIVQSMLRLGADINDQDDENRTPLHLAVQANHYDFAKRLIERGANIMALSKFNASVLFFALLPNEASSEDLCKMIDLILNSETEKKYKSDLINIATLDNQTPLARAVCHPNISEDLIKKLLEQKNEKINEQQWLVVINMIARYRKCPDKKSFDYLKPIVDLLKDSNDKPKLGELPHLICRHDNGKFLEWLYEYINKTRSLIGSQQSDYMNEMDPAGYTPLLTAVFYRSKECVEFILREITLNHNKYLLAINDDNENILHICAKRQIKEHLFDIIWEKLLAELLNVSDELLNMSDELLNMSDVRGAKPLQVAARFNNNYMCGKVLKYIETNSDKTKLFALKSAAAREASLAGNLEILKRIIQSASKEDLQDLAPDEIEKLLQSRDKNGYTCLHLAAAQGHENIVDFLVNKTKIDVDAIGDRRLTPLHMACENGHLKAIQVLLNADASTTLRNAQVYNCLEIAIINQHKKVVHLLLTHSTWKEMMRNAQPIENTEAFDTPMRKLIRYMADMAIWLIDNRFTKVVGGPGQKTYKTIYNYEFYEDMFTAKDWYKQGANVKFEPQTSKSLWHTRGVEAIHTHYYCCYSNNSSFACCFVAMQNENSKWYTTDAYTLVRNHPLFIVSQQKNVPKLVEHSYHTHLRDRKLHSFGLWFFVASLFLYVAYLGLFTSAILFGKHPKYFYDKAQVNMTVDLSTCEYVSDFISNNPNLASEALKSVTYKRIKMALYVILSIFITKNLIFIAALFPKVLRIGGSYVEILALVLSYVYVLDWFDWQSDTIMRCPIQYQIGAMGLLIAYVNFLVYLRTAPVLGLGIYVVMLQVISVTFLRFLPVLLVIICGFGFTYWMLLQYQPVYGTPIEALLRTSLMLFDLGYEDRLYDPEEGGEGYYKLVYVIFMLTAVVCSIFVINLLIGLAVGEIPSLKDKGTLWRTQLLFSLLSDYEILRFRFLLFFDYVTFNRYRDRPIPWFRLPLYFTLEKDELVPPMGMLGALWHYTQKHFFKERIQDNIKLSIKSTEEKTDNNSEKYNDCSFSSINYK